MKHVIVCYSLHTGIDFTIIMLTILHTRLYNLAQTRINLLFPKRGVELEICY